jgi:hypothetical protein
MARIKSACQEPKVGAEKNAEGCRRRGNICRLTVWPVFSIKGRHVFCQDLNNIPECTVTVF